MSNEAIDLLDRLLRYGSLSLSLFLSSELIAERSGADLRRSCADHQARLTAREALMHPYFGVFRSAQDRGKRELTSRTELLNAEELVRRAEQQKQ